MQAITDLVRTAAGIDPARGDAVEVQVVEFDTGAADAAQAALEAADAAAASEAMWSTIRTAGIISLLALALVVGLVVFARRSRRQAREDVDLGELDAAPAGTWDATVPLSLDDAMSSSTLRLPGMPDAPTELLPVPEPSPELLTAERKRAEIDALAARDPDRTADLLRELLDERPTP